MKWKYIIVSISDGEVKGTNDPVVAEYFRTSEDDFVIDCEHQVWLGADQEYEIKGYDT